MSVLYSSSNCANQVQLYPDTPATRVTLTSLAPQLYLPLRAGTQVLGHQLGLNDELSLFHVAFPTWGVSFGEDEEVATIIKSASKGREVASVGRVKGDRSTLYKYLNPHLSVVISAPSRASSTPSRTCGLYVVDTVKGTVLYHVLLPVVDGTCDIQAVLDENWLVYSYYDDSTEIGSAKGYRVVSVEMYEGYGADEKISRCVHIRRAHVLIVQGLVLTNAWLLTVRTLPRTRTRLLNFQCMNKRSRCRMALPRLQRRRLNLECRPRI